MTRDEIETIISQAQKTIREIDAWSQANPKKKPADVEHERVFLDLATTAIGHMDAERDEEAAAAIQRLDEYRRSLMGPSD